MLQPVFSRHKFAPAVETLSRPKDHAIVFVTEFRMDPLSGFDMPSASVERFPPRAPALRTLNRNPVGRCVIDRMTGPRFSCRFRSRLELRKLLARLLRLRFLFLSCHLLPLTFEKFSGFSCRFFARQLHPKQLDTRERNPRPQLPQHNLANGYPACSTCSSTRPPPGRLSSILSLDIPRSNVRPTSYENPDLFQRERDSPRLRARSIVCRE